MKFENMTFEPVTQQRIAQFKADGYDVVLRDDQWTIVTPPGKEIYPADTESEQAGWASITNFAFLEKFKLDFIKSAIK
jgi:hypothetical protein